jgi:cysteine-rich repeat protein
MKRWRKPVHERLALLTSLLFPAVLGACLDKEVVQCADGRICPASLRCDAAHQGCVLPQQLDSCANKPQGTSCSYRGVPVGACYEQVCLPSGCGNGILDTSEVCDDNNRFHGDGCSADCRSNETCGNQFLDVTVGEQCDPGPDDDPSLCRSDCVSARCGDGVPDLAALELCDEGAENSMEPDADCRLNCQPKRCGDRVVDSGEICDDGNTLSNDGCSADCKSNETCGNLVVDAVKGETCEPPTQNGFCRMDCTLATCGDGELDENVYEQCDNGAQNSVEPNAECRPNCQKRRCGDGILDDGEACDDGNQVDVDGCSHDCKSTEVCGNGYPDFRKGETCDDANFLSHDGCSSRCRLESPVWTQLSDQLITTTANLAYDPMRDVALLNAFTRTHELRGTRWQLLNPNHLPDVIYDPGLAFDAARRRVVLFGGKDGNGIDVSGTYEWDGTDWHDRSHANGPSRRAFVQLAYDSARQRTVMFGGKTEDLATSTVTWHSDTWEWDGQAWTQIAATGGPPAGNYGTTYDPVTGRVVAFNGSDFWYFENGAWTSAAASLPTPVEASLSRSLAFDTARGRVYDFSVSDAVSVQYALFEWDGSAWHALPLPPSVPDRGAKLFYRTARRRLTLVETDQTWEWDGAAWVLVGSLQDPSRTHVMVYDPLRGTTLMFGGGVRGEPGPFTWIWDGSTWSDAAPTHSPPARFGHAMAYDPTTRQVVMFGGASTPNQRLADTWIWDGEDWSEAQPASSPSAREGHSMVYDAARGEIVLFGGGLTWPDFRNDTWTWNGQTWIEQHPTGVLPHPRALSGLTYDPIRRDVVLFGGEGTTEMYQDVPTWSWNGAGWARVPVPGISYRAGPADVYDPNLRATMLIGGGFVNNVHTMLLRAVPTSATALPWEPLPIPFSRDPNVENHNAVYEPLQGRVLVAANADAPMWELSYRHEDDLDEVCQNGFDIDGDALTGCADPDCWGFCTPLCPPGAECDDALPHCGDGTCNTALETCRLCPEDCTCEALCGDLFCDPGETVANCPGDCTPAPEATP